MGFLVYYIVLPLFIGYWVFFVLDPKLDKIAYRINVFISGYKILRLSRKRVFPWDRAQLADIGTDIIKLAIFGEDKKPTDE